MANVLVRDLSNYNRKITLTNGHVVQFAGRYATISDTDAALLVLKGSGEFVANYTVNHAPALSTATQAVSTAVIAQTKTVVTANQKAGQSGLSAATSAANTAEIARATAALNSNLETSGAVD